MKYILGVDIGTTAIKAAVFDSNGQECGSRTEEYTLITPSAGMVELAAESYVETFSAAIKSAIESSGVNIDDIVSLGMSAQGETLLCLNQNGSPLRRAIVWMDNRAVDEAAFIERKLGRDIVHKTTGQVGMDAIWPASKMLWLQRNEPDIYNKTAKFVMVKDYLIYLLTGRLICEDSLLCSTMWWDINTREYWPEMLDLLEIKEEQLPEIVRQGEMVGTISQDAAERFGLSKELMISAGALDQACGALGVGNVNPGVFSESTGSALTSVTIVDKPILDPAMEMPCFASAIPGKYMLHAFSTGGMAIRWYRDVFCAIEKEVAELSGINAYTLIDREVEQVPPGSEGLIVLPHLQGSGPPDTNNLAKGVFYGVTLAHKKQHFSRGIMEGVTMVLRRMIEATEALGIDIKEIISLGGGSKSSVWCQIKSDATGLTIKIMKDTESAACLGAAILAGVGAGVWESPEEAATSITREDKIYQPNEKNKEVYDQVFDNYKKLQEGTREFFKVSLV
ncbi:FGGY family carbohydrate kinase [Priestia megaterium]|uniref:xylulokinase n=1 Tax=Priestia megaterium TaxID=1404 RepID=UPI0021601438|nr:FGGY family carbohydrate kinase [Priestia megaterium]MCR8928891.1 FGGY family carbohydrate kinase [Priestia megaterium]